jgi:hypothetical protein
MSIWFQELTQYHKLKHKPTPTSIQAQNHFYNIQRLSESIKYIKRPQESLMTDSSQPQSHAKQHDSSQHQSHAIQHD